MVVPHAKAQPGFQRGTWMDNGAGTGTALIVFDPEENATAAEKALQPHPDGPRVLNCWVVSVLALRPDPTRAPPTHARCVEEG